MGWEERFSRDFAAAANIEHAALGRALETIREASPLKLTMISNRGTKVYPDGNVNIDCVDHYRCRFVGRSGAPLRCDGALALARPINEAHEVCQVERLLKTDGADGFTKAQGED